MRAKQTVIVKKSHPDVQDRADARQVAARYADRIYTSRETSGSFRFRQRPPEDFVPDTFRTRRVNRHVSIVTGELKEGRRRGK